MGDFRNGGLRGGFRRHPGNCQRNVFQEVQIATHTAGRYRIFGGQHALRQDAIQISHSEHIRSGVTSGANEVITVGRNKLEPSDYPRVRTRATRHVSKEE
jgi:hypothetical protein